MNKSHTLESKSFQETVRELQEVSWENLPESKLAAMHDAVMESQRKLYKQLKAVQKSLNEDIESNDVSAFETHRYDVQRAESHYQQLEQIRVRLYNTRQRVIVRNGIKRILGNTGLYLLERAILILIALVLGILLYEMYYNYDLPKNTARLLFAIDAFACTVFLTEFFMRLAQAEDKRWFWQANWIDFASSIPIPPVAAIAGLDLNTWGRAIRLVRILRLWRAFRILSFLWRGMERLQRVTDVRLLKKSIIWALLMIVLGAVIVHIHEDSTDPDVATLSQSMWWSFNTVATGGFVDLYNPEKMLSRLVTAMLVVAGLVVMGAFIATLTSAYRGEITRELRTSQYNLHDDIAEIISTQKTLLERIHILELEMKGDKSDSSLL